MVHLDTSDRFTRFVSHLNSMIGAEPDIQEVPPRVPDDGPVLALVYVNAPEPGCVSGFTYGLSLGRQAGPVPHARELCITMRSSDPAWARIPAVTVAALRGMCPFDPEMVIGYMKPYVPGSGLSSLLLGTPPSGLALADRIDLASSDAHPVEIVGAYPIYASERNFIHAQGAEALWKSGWDPFDPARPAVV
ncbi:suppressor of fused domain protein [Streptomyces scopuliridis]|uniref:suppressor of fused domain protein n=1 Tax=Streptomyces scopuliridis TaxID=452529 RepID=UPI00341B12E5